MLPCRRFADVLADACARLGADVGRYSFIAVDFHHILLAGLPAHSLALRPAHSRGHLYVTSYTEGFSHFVTSMTAPVASGWSEDRQKVLRGLELGVNDYLSRPVDRNELLARARTNVRQKRYVDQLRQSLR